jgi:hypothetical protein
MPVCPKCGFNGQNTKECERCGIIFDRMHTEMEVKPFKQRVEELEQWQAQQGAPRPTPTAAGGGGRPGHSDEGAPTEHQVKRVSPAGLQGGLRLPQPVTVPAPIPIPEAPPELPRLRRWPWVLAAIAALPAGYMLGRDAAQREPPPADLSWLQTQHEAIATEARDRLSVVSDVAAARADAAALARRVRELREALDRTETYAPDLREANLELTGFLDGAVLHALDRAPSGVALVRVDQAHLRAAAAALERARAPATP